MAGGFCALAAPYINRGRFRLFAGARSEYSARTIDLVQRSTVIDMLGLLTLVAGIVLLFTGALLLAATRDTAWRLPAGAGLVLLYGAGLAVAWRRFQDLAALGDRAFAGLRAELATDAALLRSNL